MAGSPWGRLFRRNSGTVAPDVEQVPGAARVLAAQPGIVRLNRSSRRLNRLYSGMPSCSAYLEIGVRAGATLENVDVPFRWGVDPMPTFDATRLPQGVRFSAQESDVFFGQLARQQRFDLIFLDGMHEWRQTYRDLLNALNHAPSHALILIDDVVPSDEFSAIPDQVESRRRREEAGHTDRAWHGDVYKVLLAIVDFHPELDFRVVGDRGAGDNPQAVVWRRDPAAPAYDLSIAREREGAFADLGYADVFLDGKTPDSFRVVDEVAGVNEALDASRRLWARSG